MFPLELDEDVNEYDTSSGPLASLSVNKYSMVPTHWGNFIIDGFKLLALATGFNVGLLLDIEAFLLVEY